MCFLLSSLQLLNQHELALGPEICEDAERSRVLTLFRSEHAAVIEEGLVRPVATVFQPREEPLHHLVLARKRTFLEVLGDSRGKPIFVFEPLEAGSERPVRVSLHMKRT